MYVWSALIGAAGAIASMIRLSSSADSRATRALREWLTTSTFPSIADPTIAQVLGLDGG